MRVIYYYALRLLFRAVVMFWLFGPVRSIVCPVFLNGWLQTHEMYQTKDGRYHVEYAEVC